MTQEAGLPAPVSDAADYPVSAGQQRLWVLDRLTPGSAVYNMTGAFRIAGPVDADRLRCVFGILERRHESLRTEIVVRDGKPRQRIRPAGELLFTIEDLSGEAEARALAIADKEALLPFDLSAGPLWRVRLLRLGPEHGVLVCTLHHAISDGWSSAYCCRRYRRCTTRRRQARCRRCRSSTATMWRGTTRG